MDLPPNSRFVPAGVDDEGRCKALVRDGKFWKCSEGYNTPYRCLGDPLKLNSPNCSITYFEIRIK